MNRMNIVRQGEAEDRKAGLKRRAKSWGGKDSRRKERQKTKRNLRAY